MDRNVGLCHFCCGMSTPKLGKVEKDGVWKTITSNQIWGFMAFIKMMLLVGVAGDVNDDVN